MLESEEQTGFSGICLTNDVDMMLCHMNNARYLRELDFARYHFYERTGLFRRLFHNRTITLQTASCMRYRQSIGLFAAYQIQTKLIYWDTRNVYLEHQFKTMDGCLRAVGLSRQTILTGTINGLFEKDNDSDGPLPQPPTPTAELEHWILSMEASKQIIRSFDNETDLKESSNSDFNSRCQ
ncbi:protein THEM6-like isoform X2 [Lycorma delicatula]|uniref:protein THEM6-like isoform X2 n=1 Tax=Lycorma delicatula TaxID=130591 RepID=UPI003F51990B